MSISVVVIYKEINKSEKNTKQNKNVIFFPYVMCHVCTHKVCMNVYTPS